MYVLSFSYHCNAKIINYSITKAVKGKGNLKAPRPCIAQDMRQQKGASPNKTRRQILKIFIIHIELKSYVPSVL